MRAILCAALIAAGGSVAGMAADATPARAIPTDATLARLIADSLAARPELRRARASVEAEVERVPQAGALPDPMLQLGVQNDGFTSIGIGEMENSYVSIMISQTFPWPGKRGLREDVVRLGVDQATLEVARVQLGTEAEVRRTYLDLLLVRDRLELLERLRGIWEQSLATARARYEAGAGAQSDVLRAQLEL
jgi:cobalt-zinc-cadmium efflux system outer membrane protein